MSEASVSEALDRLIRVPETKEQYFGLVVLLDERESIMGPVDYEADPSASGNIWIPWVEGAEHAFQYAGATDLRIEYPLTLLYENLSGYRITQATYASLRGDHCLASASLETAQRMHDLAEEHRFILGNNAGKIAMVDSVTLTERLKSPLQQHQMFFTRAVQNELIRRNVEGEDILEDMSQNFLERGSSLTTTGIKNHNVRDIRHGLLLLEAMMYLGAPSCMTQNTGVRESSVEVRVMQRITEAKTALYGYA